MGRHPAYPSAVLKWGSGSFDSSSAVVQFREGLNLEVEGQSYQFLPAQVATLSYDIIHALMIYNSKIVRFVNPVSLAYYQNEYLPGVNP